MEIWNGQKRGHLPSTLTCHCLRFNSIPGYGWMVHIVGFKIWIFGQIIELLKEAQEGPLIWTPESEHAFCN